MSKKHKKAGDTIKKSSSKEHKSFINYLFYDSGKILLAMFILALVVALAMIINKARAHLIVDIDSRLNNLYEEAEMYNESETNTTDEVSETQEVNEYTSVITDEIRDEAAKNNVTVEEQIESNYNDGLANYLIIMVIITIFAALLGMAHRH